MVSWPYMKAMIPWINWPPGLVAMKKNVLLPVKISVTSRVVGVPEIITTVTASSAPTIMAAAMRAMLEATIKNVKNSRQPVSKEKVPKHKLLWDFFFG